MELVKISLKKDKLPEGQIRPSRHDNCVTIKREQDGHGSTNVFWLSLKEMDALRQLIINYTSTWERQEKTIINEDDDRKAINPNTLQSNK